jgi:hypothetical protein
LSGGPLASPMQTSLTNLTSENRGVGLQDPVITGYYALDSLTNLPSDIRGVGLQVEPFITEYYVSDILTYVPSENRDFHNTQ